MIDIAGWAPAWVHGQGQALIRLALAYARVAPVCLMLPFFNERVLGRGVLRQSLVIVVAIALWPSIRAASAGLPDNVGALLGQIAREGGIGISIGVTLAMPFWICMGAGELIDNQRGATLSDVLDPAHGVEVSTFGAFMSVFATAAFLANDGMRIILETLDRSYVAFGAQRGPSIDWLAYIRFLDVLSRDALRLSGPVVAAMFLTEVVLGTLSRFATQMGIFALAFSIKSLVAFVVFVLYFGPAVSRLFGALGEAMHGLRFAP